MSSNLKPIKKGLTAGDKVYKQLKQAILYGGFSADETLTEVKLSSILEISRTPIRSAIQQLVSEGLLVTVPRKGVAIRNITSAEEKEIFLLRSLIEVEIIKEVIEKVNSLDELTQLEEIIEEQERIIETEDNIRFIELDQLFHSTLARKANLFIMEGVLENLHNLQQLIGLKAVKKRGRMEDVVEEHKLIINAVKERKTELASELVLSHLNNTKEALNLINDQPDEQESSNLTD